MARKLSGKKARPRGGASLPCPSCGGPSEVAVTRLRGTVVHRWRRCKARACRASFRSQEAAE